MTMMTQGTRLSPAEQHVILYRTVKQHGCVSIFVGK